jgi:hypothetical protein
MRTPGPGYAPVPVVANVDLPRSEATAKTVAKTVANPEVASKFATGGKSTDEDDFLDDIDRGKSAEVDEISKGWRLETNSDGRLRWRWQVKDGAGNSATYEKPGGTLGYTRGSRYVGITQRDDARAKDSKRTKGKHKRGRRGKAGS